MNLKNMEINRERELKIDDSQNLICIEDNNYFPKSKTHIGNSPKDQADQLNTLSKRIKQQLPSLYMKTRASGQSPKKPKFINHWNGRVV